MRIEYSEDHERNLRISELESILLNHEDEYTEAELDEMEKELQMLTETNYEIWP